MWSRSIFYLSSQYRMLEMASPPQGVPRSGCWPGFRIQSISVQGTKLGSLTYVTSSGCQYIILISVITKVLAHKEENLCYSLLRYQPAIDSFTSSLGLGQQIYNIKRMNEGQEKRQTFRLQIRRRQIAQMFNQVRRAHQPPEPQSLSPPLDESQRLQLVALVRRFLNDSLLHYNNRNLEELMGLIIALKQKAQAYPKAVSMCLDEELRNQVGQFVDADKKDISKQSIYKLRNHYEQSSIIEEQTDLQAKITIIHEIIKISQHLQYSKFSLESSIVTIKLLWNVIQSGCHLPSPAAPATHLKSIDILNGLCDALSKFMEGPMGKLVRDHLQKLGLSAKLVEIINISGNFGAITVRSMLRVLHLFNLKQANTQSSPNQINGISIISTEDALKSKFCLFCIYHLHKRKEESAYELALRTLALLFEQNTYFIDSIKEDYYPKILELLLHPSRPINTAALDLLVVIAYYSPSACDQMLQSGNILDSIQQRLVMERDMLQDEHSRACIQTCTCILSDLLCTKNRKVKQLIVDHNIWDFIYNALDQENKLFPVTAVFRYLFMSFSRKERIRFLPSFLQAVSNLDLGNKAKPVMKELRRTLIEVYYFSEDHASENSHEHLVAMYETYNLIRFVQQDEL